MRKVKISGIYRILNTLNNKFYIGSSVDIYTRWSVHKHKLFSNKHNSIKLQRAWNKYGEQHFKFEILEICEPIRDTLILLEQKYLDLKPDYNICYFASNTFGFRHSEKTKKILSDLRKNRKFEYHHSENSRLLISLANKNRIVSEETRSKQRKPMLMIDIKSGTVLKEFKSIGDAGIFVGNYNRRVEIKKAAQGKRKSAYGYKWEYKNK